MEHSLNASRQIINVTLLDKKMYLFKDIYQ